MKYKGNIFYDAYCGNMLKYMCIVHDKVALDSWIHQKQCYRVFIYTKTISNNRLLLTLKFNNQDIENKTWLFVLSI